MFLAEFVAMTLTLESVYKLANGRYYSDYNVAVAKAKELAKEAAIPFVRESAVLSVDVLVASNPSTGHRKFFHLLPVVPRVDSAKEEDPGRKVVPLKVK
jgi:hypothetical protein